MLKMIAGQTRVSHPKMSRASSLSPLPSHQSQQPILSSPIISTHAILLPPTINQLKRNVPAILHESTENTKTQLIVSEEGTKEETHLTELISGTDFQSVYSMESFTSHYTYRNLISEAWNGKNVSFIFHGGATEQRRRKILFNTAQQTTGSLPFILRVSETILKQLHLKSDKFSSCRYKMEISMLELYKNKVFDVLYPMNAENYAKSTPNGLPIHSHAKYGSYCPSCANFRVRSMLEIRKLLELGMRERPSRRLYQQENDLDQQGARGVEADWDEILDAPPVTHLIFQIVLTQTTFDFSKQNPATEIISKISIVDVGGKVVAPSKASSVSVPSTSSNQSSVDAWLDQSNNILSTVIQRLSSATPAVSSSTDASYIPYRDSNLTLLLKDQLGGNCITSALLCMGTTEEDREQIESTLDLAQKLGTIHNRPTVNRYKNDAILSEIEEHVAHLEEQISSAIVQDEKYKALKEELEQEKEIMTVIKKSPKERVMHFAKRRKSNVSEMLKTGVSISAFGDVLEYDTSAVPYLLNMKAYISTYEKLVYFLTQSTLSVGSGDENDIVLGGKGMKLHHALLRKVVNELEEEQVVVEGIQDATIFVNGDEIEPGEVARLRTGDRLIIGEHIFQYAHPRFPLSPQAESYLLVSQLSPKKSASPSSSTSRDESFHIDLTAEDTSSLVGWERAKRELIAKRTAALDTEVKKREQTLQKLVQEILTKEDELKRIEQSVLKVQLQLEIAEKLVEEKSESTQQMQSKMKQHQKYFTNIKSQEAVLLKEIQEHKEELQRLEEEVRVARKENRIEQELKMQLSMEISMIKQEQKAAIAARYEFQQAQEHHEQQLRKSKELELDIRDKSLALTQKVLDIREKNIILRQKGIEIQQKDIAVREKEVSFQEKTMQLDELNSLIQQRSRECERLQDEFVKYDKQFQDFLRYKDKKRGWFFRFSRRKSKRVQQSTVAAVESTPTDRKSATFKATITSSASG